MLGFPMHNRAMFFSPGKLCLGLTAILCCLLLSPGVSPAGMVTYSFDDGDINTYDVAVPILEAKGHVGTINAVLTWVGYTNRMTVEQLLEVEGKGWEICAHSATHPKFDLIPQKFTDELLTGWSPAPGMSNTYQTTTYTYDQLPLVFEDGQALRKRASVSEVEAKPGSFFFNATGHVVYVHTRDGSSPAAHEMRADSVERELESSIHGLRGMGLNVQNFVVPHSQWNGSRAAMAKNFYHSAAAAGGPPPENLAVNPLPLKNPVWLARRVIYPDTPIETAKAWVDYAVPRDIWLVLMFHGICDGAECWPTANLTALAEHIISTGIPVVTQEQGYQQAKAYKQPVRDMSWLNLLTD